LNCPSGIYPKPVLPRGARVLAAASFGAFWVGAGAAQSGGPSPIGKDRSRRRLADAKDGCGRFHRRERGPRQDGRAECWKAGPRILPAPWRAAPAWRRRQRQPRRRHASSSPTAFLHPNRTDSAARPGVNSAFTPGRCIRFDCRNPSASPAPERRCGAAGPLEVRAVDLVDDL